MIFSKILPFLVFLTVLTTVPVSSADVVINEFMAVNGSTLVDGDGNASDWIEIHNTSESDVDLTGWFLTDDPGDLQKWPFPVLTIHGNEFLVLFASGQEVDDYVDPLGYLHTNFRLSRNDAAPFDSLLLVMPDGVTVAHGYPDYPEQAEDVSYGLAQNMEFGTLVREGADAVALIPYEPVDNWADTEYDDSDWLLRGGTGVGYERNTGYETLINLDVEAMYGVNRTVYIRIQFEVLDPSVFDLMTLRMKYDDGFIAYLNGDWIAEANPPVGTPSWDSAASTQHDASLTEYEDFDVTPHISLLQPGTNVLAIHGLNNSLTSSDLLFLPELIAVDLSGAQEEMPMFLASPTPWNPNVTGVLGYVSDVRFSVDRGFFTEPFQVTLSTATEGAKIYYTLNGRKPTLETGIPYGGSIQVSGTTLLRAAAFKAGHQPSKTGTQTYLFLENVMQQTGAGFPNTWGHAGADYAMDPDVVTATEYRDTIMDDLKSVPSVSLVLHQDDIFAAGGVGIYPSGEGIPRATSMELIDPQDTNEFQIDCSVEITGGTSTDRWKIDKLSMRVRFKEPYGPTKLRYPVFGDEGPDRYDTLILDARLNQCWAYHRIEEQRRLAQYTRDQYAPNLQNILGGYGPRGIAVHLYVCGLYWGLYWMHERPDESFASEYLGGDRDDYDVLKHNMSTVVNGSNTDYVAMVQLAASGLSSDEKYQQIQQYLDVPNFIDYMLVNFFIGNTDWAHQNWYASRNVVDPAGRWRYHCWDSEHILKGLSDNVTTRDNAGGPTAIHQDLCANAEYRLLFADHVHKHFFNGGALTVEKAVATYQELLDEVDRAVVGESARWGDNGRPDLPYTRNVEWVTERDRLLYEYFPQRSGIVLNQLKARNLYPSVAAPMFNQNGGSFANGFLLTMTASNPIYYTFDGTDPRDYGTGLPVGIPYTGPMPLDWTSLVKARTLSAGQWSALNEALFVLDIPSTLRITELMYHARTPSGGEAAAGRTADDFDFIELRNTGDETIGLAGIRFTDGVNFDLTKAAKQTLSPGEYVLLVRNLAAFRDRYPNWADLNIAGEFQYPAQSLAESGERLTLKDGLGRVILSFSYDDEWYVNTDGLGYSLVATNEDASPDAWGDKAGWRPSAKIDGSPGQDDPAPPEFARVVINEARTTGPARDAIELYNPGPNAAQLGGWFLTDDHLAPQKFRILDGTELASGDFLVFDEDDFNTNPATSTSFALSSLGEEVYLYSADAEGNLTGYVHGFRFGAAEEGMTFGRHIISTGEDHFVPQIATTLEGPNAGPKVGPVVINEIMFNPLPVEGTNSVIFEYIELRNTSSQESPLFDPDEPENTWRLGAGVQYTFPTGASIPSGGYALVVSFDPATEVDRMNAFCSRYSLGTNVQMFGPYTGRLENLGERVTLLKAGSPKQPPDPDAGLVPYVAVDQVDYSNTAPWPTGADGTGESLQRIVGSAYGNDPVNWQVAPPTPASPNAGSSAEDTDADGMLDTWEQVIVDFDPADAIDSILKVERDDDFDNDGASNFAEYLSGTSPVDSDSDDDGYTDGDELTENQSDPLNPNSTPPDNDGDHISDLNDPDDDDDGVPDTLDAFPFDATEWLDTDGDGIGNNADPDDDDDGYSDVDELTENQSDPLDAESTPPDNDGDYISDLNDPDDDNDGMPDTWEHDYGLNPFVDDAAEDKDEDGQCNYDELIAGTDPTNPLSLLAVSAVVSGSDSTMIIRWQSVSGKFYSILRSSNVSEGFEEIEAANIPATPPENSYTVDTNGSQSFFYRVAVEY